MARIELQDIAHSYTPAPARPEDYARRTLDMVEALEIGVGVDREPADDRVVEKPTEVLERLEKLERELEGRWT